MSNITQEITITWCIQDVQELYPVLSDKAASMVLEIAKREHDANVGINWDVLKHIVWENFPEVA